MVFAVIHEPVYINAVTCHARFAELFGGTQASDRVRGQPLPKVGPTLDYLDEAFTSENWIVSI